MIRLFILSILCLISIRSQTVNSTCIIYTPQSCISNLGIFVGYEIFGTNCQNTLCQSEGFIIPSINCFINFGNGTCAVSMNYNNTYTLPLEISVGYDNQYTGTTVGSNQNLGKFNNLLLIIFRSKYYIWSWLL